MQDGETLTVFYDGACPLCAREIAFYRRRKGSEALSWVDLGACAPESVATGLSKEAALARFHVRDAEGKLLSGGAAFAALWAALPGFRLFGRAFQVGPFPWILEWAYRVFLTLRPGLRRLMPPRRVS